MKVVAVLGSPRKESRSARLAEQIMEGARAAGHEVIVYKINEMNVRGCQGCCFCKEHGVDCILEDDLMPYWKDLHTCGALILAAPNYCSQVCGPMITFMNRHYCIMGLDGTTLEPGKIKLIGVFAQGAPSDYHCADAAYDWYLGDFLARRMVMTEKFIISGDTDLSAQSSMMTRAYETGRSL